MLSRQNRFLKKEEIAKTRKLGRSFFFQNIELKTLKNAENKTKIGIITGLKFSKKAVERNKAKRWAREVFREQLPKIKTNKNIIAIIKKGKEAKTTKKQIEESLKKVLEKSNLVSI